MTVKDVDFSGKRALVRVDFNVPMEGKTITDPSKISSVLPTIHYILDHGGSVILMSHLGRPKGVTPELSLKPVAEELSKLLGKPVRFSKEFDVKPKPGEVVLLENLRFFPEEKKTDPSFVKKLAKLGDIYVNDAFGTAHRKHSSTYYLAKEFPKAAVAGLLMEQELDHFDSLLHNPSRPFYAIIGGAKISTKIEILRSLVDRVDGVLVVGAMAHTFFVAEGLKVGKSLYEEECVESAKEILSLYKEKGILLHLPIDVVVVPEVYADAKPYVVDIHEIPEDWFAVDVGPMTISLFSDILANAKSIFWNGPAGVFEIEPFAKGTEALAQEIGTLGVEAIVGGGDSVAAIHKLGLEKGFTHLSTGGGASLELIEKGTLPGIELLNP